MSIWQSYPRSNGDPRQDSAWSVSDLKRIDTICETFERSWRTGAPLDLKSLVLAASPSSSRLLFRELLAIELEYRNQRGQRIASNDLDEQFPDFRDLIAIVCAEAAPRPPLDEEVLPALLERHPRYEITGRLGSGGMGTVYSGRHKVLGRDVAIKVIRQNLLNAPGARERFLQEARTAALLQHPNVVAVYDAEATDDGQFLVMEAVSGADLAKTVAECGPLPWDAACDAIHQAALGLEAGRRLGMVHRDLSPRNLMLAEDGTVKLLDFGLASLTSMLTATDFLLKRGMLVGSAAFVSPEQLDDPSASDVRSDLYSLGCVMYFLVTGAPPFPTESLTELLDSHRFRPAPRISESVPDVPEPVVQIVARLLAKSPDERFQTAADLAAALAPLCTPGSASVDPAAEALNQPIVPDRQRPRLSWNSSRALLAGVLVVTLAIVLLRQNLFPHGPSPERAESPELVQGYSLLGQRQERQVRLAIAKFQRVLVTQPKNARALAALAEAYNLCGDYGWELPDHAFPQAIAAARQALEIDPDLAEGHLALAFAAATYQCQWQQADAEFRRTFELAPNLASAHHWYAWFLLPQRRLEQARTEMERAHQLAPDNLIIANNVGKVLYYSRRYSEAAERHRATLELDQDFQKAHMDLGYALIELGQIDEALAEFDRSVGISTHDRDVQAARAYARARQGKAAAVQTLLQSLEPVAADEGLAVEMAHIYAAAGDRDRAFLWLKEAFTRKSPGRVDIVVDPRLDPLRSDPRFAALLNSIGLKPD